MPPSFAAAEVNLERPQRMLAGRDMGQKIISIRSRWVWQPSQINFRCLPRPRNYIVYRTDLVMEQDTLRSAIKVFILIVVQAPYEAPQTNRA